MHPPAAIPQVAGVQSILGENGWEKTLRSHTGFAPAPGVALPRRGWASEVYLAKQMLAVGAEVEGESGSFSLPTCVNNAHIVKQTEPLDRKVLSSCFFPSLCDVPTPRIPFGYISPVWMWEPGRAAD